MHHMFFAIVVAALLAGCASELSDESTANSTTIESSMVELGDGFETTIVRYGHSEADAPVGLDACRLVAHVSRSLDTLRRWPRTIVAGGVDSCVIELLDSLGDRFAESGDAVFLEVLDSLHAVDDGYVAEYVPEVAARAAKARFSEYFEYLFSRRNASPPMEHALVEGIGSISESSPGGGAAAWQRTIREALPAASVDPQRREYLDTLLKRAGIQ